MKDSGNPGQRGQSLIIVAFLFLAVVILAAIAADVTNAYSQQRTAQNAADAAALAAAQELGHHLRGDSTTDADVAAMLEGFAGRNGVGRVTGNYLDANEVVVGQIGNEANIIPGNAFGVEATAFLTAPTFFGGVVGMDGYPLDAEAAVQFGSVCYGGDCLLPIAIFAGGFEDPEGNNPYPSFQEGQCYNLWDGAGGANFGWLNWSNQGPQYSCLNYVLDGPADCSADCIVMNMDPTFCEDQPDDMVKIGDWVGGAPGINNASGARGWLDDYIDNDRIARIVVYDSTFYLGGATCGKTLWKEGELHKQQGTMYVVAGFAAFRLTGYRLSVGQGNAVTRDEVDPTTCVDFPGSNGKCCLEWTQLEEDGTFECALWGECEYGTGEVNRITGIAIPWTADAYDTCEGVGNFWAPRLTR